MSTPYFFVGPYVECRSPEDVWPADPELASEWSELLNDPRRMGWNMLRGNPRRILIDGVEMYQYCGVPIEDRSGVPRWPMLFELKEPLRNSENFDWRDIDPDAEIDWFKRTYDQEMIVLGKIFTIPLTFRWGGVYWEE